MPSHTALCRTDEDWLQLTLFFLEHRHRIMTGHYDFYQCMNSIFLHKENGGIICSWSSTGEITGMLGFCCGTPQQDYRNRTDVWIDNALILQESNFPGLFLRGLAVLTEELGGLPQPIEAILFQAGETNDYINRLYLKFAARIDGSERKPGHNTYRTSLPELSALVNMYLGRRIRPGST